MITKRRVGTAERFDNITMLEVELDDRRKEKERYE